MSKKPPTILTHAGRPDSGPVNRPVQRGSTFTFRSFAEMEAGIGVKDLRTTTRYGRVGNPNAHDFENVMTELEGGYGAVTASSGFAIIMLVLSTFTKPGDHILIVDTAYGPVRRFCDQHLATRGVAIEYYDPLIGGGIAEKFRRETRIVYVESPGSQTFEVQDVPAITAAAKTQGILTVADNTWATPLFFQPLKHGIDIALHSATKYLSGHSDLFLGVAVCAREEIYGTLKESGITLGQCAAPDDLVLALRGLRTLDVRLQRHQENATAVIDWLKDQPQVERVLYPALSDCTGHDIWKHDFSGATGLLSVTFKTKGKQALARFTDGLEYFPLGFSWGGYESLAAPLHLTGERTVGSTDIEGVRLHIGLEDPQDLIADLAAGLGRMSKS